MNISKILSSPRYLALFEFAHQQSQGKSNNMRRTLLKDALNESVKERVLNEKKADLLIGIQRKILKPLQKMFFDLLNGKTIDFEIIVPEEEYRYLLVKIFSEDDSCHSHNLESLVMNSFKELDTDALSRRENKTVSEFQDIVNFMRSIIDNLGKEDD